MERKKTFTHTCLSFFPLNYLLGGRGRSRYGWRNKMHCRWKFTLNKTCHIWLNRGFVAYSSNSSSRYVATYLCSFLSYHFLLKIISLPLYLLFLSKRSTLWPKISPSQVTSLLCILKFKWTLKRKIKYIVKSCYLLRLCSCCNFCFTGAKGKLLNVYL